MPTSPTRRLLDYQRCPPNLSAEEKLKWHGWNVVESECWEWLGPLSVSGYGDVRINTRLKRAHRVAYETWVGPIPEGLLIRHKCDNRPCINPNHLETGTDADNTQDKMKRGRYRKGRTYYNEQHPQAKVTDTQVLEIRRRYATERITQKNLGAEYGISQAQVSLIVLNKQRRLEKRQ